MLMLGCDTSAYVTFCRNLPSVFILWCLGYGHPQAHTCTTEVRVKLGILRTGLGGANDVGSEPAGSVHTFWMT